MVCGQTHELAVVAHEDSAVAATESHRVTDDGPEHRLHIGRRAGDHAEDLAGCRLLSERLGERRLSVADHLVLPLPFGFQFGDTCAKAFVPVLLARAWYLAFPRRRTCGGSRRRRPIGLLWFHANSPISASA